MTVFGARVLEDISTRQLNIYFVKSAYGFFFLSLKHPSLFFLPKSVNVELGFPLPSQPRLPFNTIGTKLQSEEAEFWAANSSTWDKGKCFNYWYNVNVLFIYSQNNITKMSTTFTLLPRICTILFQIGNFCFKTIGWVGGGFVLLKSLIFTEKDFKIFTLKIS